MYALAQEKIPLLVYAFAREKVPLLVYRNFYLNIALVFMRLSIKQIKKSGEN